LPFIYSVKFVCGLQVVPSNPSTVPNEPPVKPGNYATSVNVPNYHSGSATTFCKKAVVALPEGSGAKGTVSPFVRDILDFNQAEEIDCSDIVTLLHPSQTCHNPGPPQCSKLGELQLEVVPEQPLPGP
jgi:hypothetical protein